MSLVSSSDHAGSSLVNFVTVEGSEEDVEDGVPAGWAGYIALSSATLCGERVQELVDC